MSDSSSGNAKAVSVRVASQSGGQVGGGKKHMLRKKPIPKYIDQDRMHLNSIIEEPLQASDLREICKERRKQREGIRALKSNATIGFEGIITFGTEAQSDFEKLSVEDQDKAYREIAEAIAERVNSTVTGLVAHRDETAPHAHFQMPGFDLDGKPLSQTIKRGVTSEFQTIAAKVIKRHVETIERGRGKYERLAAGAEWSDVVNKSVRQLHEELPADIAKLEAERDELLAKIEKNERLAARSAEKASKSEAAAKRATTYENRAEAARTALQRLEGRIGDLDTKKREVAATEARLGALERRSDELTNEIHSKEAEAVEIVDKAKAKVAMHEAAFKALSEAVKAIVPAGFEAAIREKYRELMGIKPASEKVPKHDSDSGYGL